MHFNKRHCTILTDKLSRGFLFMQGMNIQEAGNIKRSIPSVDGSFHQEAE
jgi:hypothetical protein